MESESDDIAIHIKPLPCFAHEVTDFMQTMRVTTHLVARHEFHHRMIWFWLFMALYSISS